MHRAVVAMGMASALALGGCTSEPDPTGPVGTDVPGSATRTSGSVSSTTRAPTTPSTTKSTPIKLRLNLRVPRSPAINAFATYLVTRTRSVVSGSVVPGLAVVATDRELARQTRLVQDARERGLTVPAEPRAAVVASDSSDSSQVEQSSSVRLGVCLYLPSTEYVDQITGTSPAGEVPRQWAPAVATMLAIGTTGSVTWKLDKLTPATPEFRPDCRGLT